MLLRLAVKNMLVAEAAIFLCLHALGVILLFLSRLIVALLTVSARQCDLSPHGVHLYCSLEFDIVHIN